MSGPGWGALATGLANARADYLQGQMQGQQTALQRYMAMLGMQRELNNDAITNFYRQQMGNAAAARANRLDTQSEGQWTKPFASTDENGVAGMYQQNNQTGEVRRVRLGGGPSSPTSTQPTGGNALADFLSKQQAPSFNVGPMAAPRQGVSSAQAYAPSEPNAGVNGASGNIDLANPDSGAQPPQATTPQASTTTAGGSGYLSPYNKPTVQRPLSNSDKITARIRQLTAQGVPLDKANTQARLEFGQQNQPQESGIWVDDPNQPGSKVYVPRGQAFGQTQTPAGKSMSQLSGQTMQALARLGTSYNDLKQRIARMDVYENNDANLNKITPTQQAVGAVSEFQPNPEARGLGGMTGNAVGAFLGAQAQKRLAASDPAYSQYLQDRQVVGTALTETLPRPNQQLLGIEKGLSGLDAGWTPDKRSATQSRRHGAADVLGGILNEQGFIDANGAFVPQSRGGGRGGGRAGGGASTPEKQTITTDQAAFLKSQRGMSDADIAARYTVRP